jgi:hypothetical protein
MRQERAGSGEEQGKPSGEQQASSDGEKHRSAITKHRREITPPIVIPVAHSPRMAHRSSPGSTHPRTHQRARSADLARRRSALTILMGDGRPQRAICVRD